MNNADLLIRILADGLVVPVVLIGAGALLFYVRSSRYEAYCRVLMAGVTAYLLAKLIGSVYQPAAQRPFELMGVDAGASFLNNPGFPSDHVLFCTAIALAVVFEVRNKWLSVGVVGLTVLVAVGRVLALVHSPLDVVGAVLIASIGAVWYVRTDLPAKEIVHPIRQWSKPQKSGTIAKT